MSDPLRLYLDPAEIGSDGYPHAWSRPPVRRSTIGDFGYEEIPLGDLSIKDIVREQAGHRCVRCGHPYRKGQHGNGEWSPCDENCTHREPIRLRDLSYGDDHPWSLHTAPLPVTAAEARIDDGPGGIAMTRYEVEAQWRILTVHHLNGIKHDCRWWNLAALCQRCHLSIQTRVIMDRPYDRPHSAWFRPYVAGYYASLQDLDLTREEVEARIDELLAPHETQQMLDGLRS